MPEDTTITLNDGTVGIASSALSGCSGLKSIIIPESVMNIDHNAFRGCSGLKSITIPESVTSIGYGAFYECSGLTSVTIKRETPVSLSSSIFDNPQNVTLYVPVGSKADYEVAEYWKDFKEIVEIDEMNYMELANAVVCQGGQSKLGIAMNNEKEIVGFQFDLRLPDGVSILTNANGVYSASLADRKDDHSLAVDKIGDNIYRFVAVSMNNKHFAGNDGTLLDVKLKVDESVALGDYEMKVINTELTTIDKELINSVDCTATLTVQEAEPGDANGDMKVSIADVVSIIDVIMNHTPSVFIRKAADVNGDNKVSVTDAVNVIDMILNDGSSAKGVRSLK